MKTKRGISPLISWVLLVGFAVALSMMVTDWVKTQAESTTEKTVEGVEGDIRCSQVSLNVNVDCISSPGTVQMNLANRGKFTIHKIRIRQPGNTEERIITLAPTMKRTEALNRFDPAKEGDVVPIIMLEDKEVICSTRKVVVNC